MRSNLNNPDGGKLLEAPEPQRTHIAIDADPSLTVYPGQGTGNDNSSGQMSPQVTMWVSRWRQWRDGFEEKIGPDVRLYWTLYRAFDSGVLPGPNQGWRDRTVIPECFKIIETRIPRLVMGQFGGKEWFTVEARNGENEQYEEMVRSLLRQSIDEIGTRDYTGGGFIQSAIDATRYEQIMGHVWWKCFWRYETRWIKTKVPVLAEDGKIDYWEPVEAEETVYDNIDFSWVPLDSIAMDLSTTTGANGRKWSIERVQTSLEALKTEDRLHREKTGEDLYNQLDLVSDSTTMYRDSFEEPRDTEHWPLTEQVVNINPGETPVELWLCWDNVEGTLTKVANRSIILDHGYMPTPDGLDPYIGSAAVPVPGRSYGDSILHWIGPLAAYQTRIARARADEILLNIWQQFVYRAGSVGSSKLLFTPGGAIPVSTENPDRPVMESFGVLPRRPVFQEAYTEEGYRQQQAESTAGADAISQGVEATSKSRDVSATEIQQRIQQSGARWQMENLYKSASVTKPLLGKFYNLIRQNLTRPKIVRVLGESRQVDLRDLEEPIDIVVGTGFEELTKGDRLQEIQQMVQLSESPVFGPILKPRAVLEELLRNRGRKDVGRFMKTEEELKRDQQKAAAAAQAQAMAQQQAAQPAAGSAGPSGAAPPDTAASPTPEALASMGGGAAPGPVGPADQGATAPPAGSSDLLAEI